MAITKLTSDALKQPGPDNTLLGKVNEVVDAANNAAGAGTPGPGTFTTLSASQTLKTPGSISPPQITADQNNYAPTGIATATFLFLTSDAARNITGLASASDDGRHLWVYNSGSFNITFKYASGLSTTANQFFGNGAVDKVLAPATTMHLMWMATAGVWIMMP